MKQHRTFHKKNPSFIHLYLKEKKKKSARFNSTIVFLKLEDSNVELKPCTFY